MWKYLDPLFFQLYWHSREIRKKGIEQSIETAVFFQLTSILGMITWYVIFIFGLINPLLVYHSVVPILVIGCVTYVIMGIISENRYKVVIAKEWNQIKASRRFYFTNLFFQITFLFLLMFHPLFLFILIKMIFN